MKKLFFTLTTALFSLTLLAAPADEVTEKVLTAFETSFKDAKQVSWDQHNDLYEVKFTHNDINSRITYDGEGNILRTTRYYSEAQLPLFVRAKMKEKFSTKKVFGVTEVSSQDELAYYIVLEDAKSWTTIKCDSFGNTSLVKKLRKA
jgi:hypothetical protein